MAEQVCGQGIQNHSPHPGSSGWWSRCSSLDIHCPRRTSTPTTSMRPGQTQDFNSFASLFRLAKTGLRSEKMSLGDRQREDTALFPEETGLRKSGKAQSDETVITQEEKQGQGNGQQRTKEMLW